jgi:hypothetical protein
MAGELISRAALERIIQHAAELQASERDIGDGLSRDELLALGKEVGIPERYLLQALLEEETRTVVPSERGLLAAIAGPGALGAARVIAGDRATVERRLQGSLEQAELLQVKRRFADSTTWEPKAGAFASLQRAFGAGGKKFALARSREIAASVETLEPGFSQVRLRADVRNQRRQRLVGGVALFGAGAILTALTPVLGALFPWVLVPAAIMTIVAAVHVRGHRRENEDVQVALEQVLDRLERGDPGGEPRTDSPAAAVLGRIANELKRTLDF